MQFIETTSFGVRSAIYELQSKDASLSFMLFPMLHIGEPKYFEEVKYLLSQCDVVVFEGVRSKHTRWLTLSYRMLAQKKEVGLVCQQDMMKKDEIDAELIHGDMDNETFDKEWSTISPTTRLLLMLIIPILGLMQRLFGDKVFLAMTGNINDLPEPRGCCSPEEALDNLIIKKRDRVLIRRLSELYGLRKDLGHKVGVVYGAKHIPAVASLLMHKFSYRVSSAKWVTVANFD